MKAPTALTKTIRLDRLCAVNLLISRFCNFFNFFAGFSSDRKLILIWGRLGFAVFLLSEGNLAGFAFLVGACFLTG